MIKIVEISHCQCGGKGVIYDNYDASGKRFFISCDKCENKTLLNYHVESAITEWNEINQPKKAKVKYRCGNCGEEVFLGFDVCTKCGAEIIW